MTEVLVYTVRPNGEALWLPSDVTEMLGVKRGARLTPAQFEHRVVQQLIADRIVAQEARGRTGK